MNKKIILSVIIYVKNNLNYIEKSIKSIISQKNKNVELIVVDGLSTDGTYEILKKYEMYFDQFISEEDNSASEAMNKGANLSNAKFISFLSGDDTYISNSMNKIIELIQFNQVEQQGRNQLKYLNLKKSKTIFDFFLWKSTILILKKKSKNVGTKRGVAKKYGYFRFFKVT